eukprot:TRINITY_DN1701_c0_g1_i3.p1 TRINITY_DN1701_c0_g1~~TRINITY_DN1701_c0_g1_i3.p1  ORF type:complete len:108 (-),score=14.25 TRINITY_DN1701_c0_g1_i3:91-414(-)
MDVRAMEFPPDCFDAIIDKATLDCVFASRDAETDVPRAIQGIYTCLKPGGVYFCVSNAAPDRRFPFLKLASFHWTIDVLELRKPKIDVLTEVEENEVYFLYVCTKSI